MLSHADTFSLSRRYHRLILQTEGVTKVPNDQSLPGTSDKQRAYRHGVLTDSENQARATRQPRTFSSDYTGAGSSVLGSLAVAYSKACCCLPHPDFGHGFFTKHVTRQVFKQQ
ncbi:hypothetical protein Tsp_01178 [Trichinella spiralis]|uniref:hypothetical protein n=1 Tax=Trichinella spiralis TaxID=6334 RepID=UPI0001EFC663|nr:hypothetical protein Tsp_01178 [Trichinella spiralis]